MKTPSFSPNTPPATGTPNSQPGGALTGTLKKRPGLTEFSVRNYQFTLIVFIMLAAIGINSMLKMPRGEDPDIEAPTFSAIVIYPGTSPKDMEELVVNPIEKRFN